jgi:hypothetical protein
MQQATQLVSRRWSQWLTATLGSLVLCAIAWIAAPAPAQAFDNPDLLPKEFTTVVDLANQLPSGQEQKLAQTLADFEAETGWKLRVLTQFDQTPGLAVKRFWDVDNKTLLVVADSRGGNLLNFNVGGDFYNVFPRTFWIELQTRYGNQFFVRDNGENQAIVQSLESVMGCLRQGGCQFVPGLPREQWILTLVTSVLGGVICGFAAHPRKAGEWISWQWALILSPLWGILFIAFGIGPVVTRTADWLPLVRNIAGFAIGALVAFLSPVFGRPPSEAET